jgi:uncharacterized protein YceH (UPF0502 family)
MHTDAHSPVELPQLSAQQARVLGCLIEKEATTPEAYPLTVNATHTAANQKTAREPLMALDPGEVQHALRRLEELGLAKQTFSSRADRYAQLAMPALGLTRQQTALLGLLLLRGPQTAHELLTRSERMASFESVEDVRHHLGRLAQREPALVVQLARASGQREERYMHLLCGPVAAEALGSHEAQATADAAAGGHAQSLAYRVQALEQEIAALRDRLAELEESASKR